MNHHRALLDLPHRPAYSQLTVLSHTILLWYIMHLSKKANAKPANLSQSCWQVSYIQMNMGGGSSLQLVIELLSMNRD